MAETITIDPTTMAVARIKGWIAYLLKGETKVIYDNIPNLLEELQDIVNAVTRVTAERDQAITENERLRKGVSEHCQNEAALHDMWMAERERLVAKTKLLETECEARLYWYRGKIREHEGYIRLLETEIQRLDTINKNLCGRPGSEEYEKNLVAYLNALMSPPVVTKEVEARAYRSSVQPMWAFPYRGFGEIPRNATNIRIVYDVPAKEATK